MKFLKSLLSSEPNSLSSRRFKSIVYGIVFIILASMSSYGHTPNDSFIYCLAGLAGGESVLALLSNLKK